MKYSVALFVCFVAFGCASTNLKPVTDSSYVPEDDEKRVWLRVEEEEKVLNKSGLLYKDEELETYLNNVATNLYPKEMYMKLPFRIYVIKNHCLNAFAYPNGLVYVHSGMLASMDNEAQLATLLAHEMTHATHRHTVRKYRDIKNKTALLATMNVTLGGLGDIGSLATALGTFGTVASVQGYSREMETEADMEGIKVVVNAGYDPRESVKFFSHLKRELEEEDKKEPFFFGSHPRVQERVDNYEEFLKSEGQKYSGGIKNTEKFLKMTQGVLLDDAYLDLKAGRFKKARRSAEKYIAQRPDDARSYYLLGEIERQEGGEAKVEKAMAYYQEAISINSSYPDPYRAVGVLYLKRADKRQAKYFFERYLSLSGQAADRAHVEEYLRQCKEGE
jgi:beta-barrel assembly-enhancing protease